MDSKDRKLAAIKFLIDEQMEVVSVEIRAGVGEKINRGDDHVNKHRDGTYTIEIKMRNPEQVSNYNKWRLKS